MTSHELARVLLELPDERLALNVYGHCYETVHHARSHGAMRIIRSNLRYTDEKSRIVLCGSAADLPGEVLYIAKD